MRSDVDTAIVGLHRFMVRRAFEWPRRAPRGKRVTRAEKRIRDMPEGRGLVSFEQALDAMAGRVGERP